MGEYSRDPVDEREQLIKEVSEPLFESKGWMKFLAVMAIIAGGLILLFGVPFLLAGGMMQQSEFGYYPYGGFSSTMIGFVGLITLISAAIYIWMGTLLWRTATSIEASRARGSFDDFMTAQDKLRLIFKIMGIITLILVVLYGLLIIAMMLSLGSLAGRGF